MAPILPLLCPVPKVDIASQCQHFIIKLYRDFRIPLNMYSRKPCQ